MKSFKSNAKIVFITVATIVATVLNGQTHIERLKEKHRVDGWSFSGNFAWGYSGFRPHNSSFNQQNSYAVVPYELPGYPQDEFRFNTRSLDALVMDYSISLGKGIRKGLNVRGNLFYRTRQTKSWNIQNSVRGGMGGPEYPYSIGNYETFHQIGLDGFVSYNIWKNKKDKQLNVLAGVGARYNIMYDGYMVDMQQLENAPYRGAAQETFKRTGVAFSFGLGIERVHYFHNNWGYSLGIFYDRVSFTPNRMTRTELTLNGEDQLPNLDKRQTDFRFGNTANDNPDDDTKPRVLPKENYNFNVLMFRAGICYRL